MRSRLDEIFVDYPEGAKQAYQFLTEPSDQPFINISKGLDIWRVRQDSVDLYVGGITTRVELWKTNTENRDR